MAGILVAKATGRAAKLQTSGMHLEEAFEGDGVWVGQLRTPGGSVGGWHHHGDHETYTYVAAGRARFEWEADGRGSAELTEGDFAQIPPHTVHREINSGPDANLLIVFRKGRGPALVNVDPL